MCVDCVLASPRITQVDPGNEPLPEVVLSHPSPLVAGVLLLHVPHACVILVQLEN
jgi:hypothetical protein